MAMKRNLGKISGVLLDLSGTLFIEKAPTPGAVAALQKLRSAGLPLRFITNTSKESRRLLFSRIRDIGFQAEQEEVFTCLTAARQMIDRNKLRPMFLVDPAAMEEFEGVETEDPDCVMVGLAPDSFTYDNLTKAFRLVLGGAQLIAIHKTRYYKRPDGLALGPGPFVTALEFASGKKAAVVGKPDTLFYQSVQEQLNCPPSETVMIGDDIVNDIHGAQVLGIKGLLVKTGKYREGDEKSIDPPPYCVCENFAEAVELILSQQCHVSVLY